MKEAYINICGTNMPQSDFDFSFHFSHIQYIKCENLTFLQKAIT